MSTPEAVRLAEVIRTAMKDQALSGSELAWRVGQRTGKKYPAVYVSRRLNCTRPLIDVVDDLATGGRAVVSIAPDLYPICEVLGLRADELVKRAVSETRAGDS